ncbi:PTS transporter subunit EIIC [Lactobacillus mulieris]|uniref:PTS sugar transporter subunit IIC n=1 Tax=Lactobacillus mulieris TaxID=2508708 RepID=UPI00143289B8|nr:PTS transporter subunit EIIC [Lactobacillus mulieris]MCF1783648.1 PTS transporter subunit EIIC [Lactobacillus mulieris]MCW8104264.1 PTS transporter subunit EIIC [Lactobacillus mulieris]MDK6803124.1 PTS transporter subunit EIIC [Lactobacillus mulieris]MDK8382240.1 PTS transporter subunit EIIC [Lactobacillus mulieris]MDT9620382.1 PTS transporter subunit EIIC [Lactobacillus mulieris]
MKDQVTRFFNEKVNPWFGKMGQSKYLRTISESMVATLGPILVGSIAVLLMAFPVKQVQDFIASIGLTPVLAAVNSITIGAMALYVVFMMAKNLVNKFIVGDDGSMAGVISLMAFLIVTPLKISKSGTSIPTTWLGAAGVFSAMIIGLIVGRIYVFFKQKNIVIKLPDSVPPMVTKAFESLFPSIVVGILFIAIARIFDATSFGSMHQCIYSLIQQPLKGIGGSIWAFVLISLIQQILWFFGIHGTNVVMPIVQALWMSMDVENLANVAAGKPVQNILGYAFFCTITWGGLALGLVLLMLVSKSERYRTLGKVAIIPALFGITEPVIFGTPLVLNFDLAIPFIFNNTIAMIISYLLIKLHIVAMFSGVMPIFGLPLGFQAAMQGKVSIIILQLFLQLVLSTILWFPWFKRLDKKAVEEEKKAA